MLDFVTGSVTGTGADIDVELGFKPSYVKVFNKTAIEAGVAESDVALEWFEGMAADSAIKHNIAIPYDNSTAVAETKAANMEFITANGITILETSTVQTADPVTMTGFTGFRIPAAFQAASDELYYIASRN